MGQNKNNTANRKQITFDLSQKALSENYPRPKFTVNLHFYKKAYSDIKRFMKKNGFEHRQFSVYTSIDKITNTDINLLIDKLAKEMPWLTLCVNQIDVTNIGVQHSLSERLKEATKLQIEQSQGKKIDLNSKLGMQEQKHSIKERITTAKTEAERHNSSLVPKHDKTNEKTL